MSTSFDTCNKNHPTVGKKKAVFQSYPGAPDPSPGETTVNKHTISFCKSLLVCAWVHLQNRVSLTAFWAFTCGKRYFSKLHVWTGFKKKNKKTKMENLCFSSIPMYVCFHTHTELFILWQSVVLCAVFCRHYVPLTTQFTVRTGKYIRMIQKHVLFIH